MDNKTLALMIGSFILAHGVSLIGGIIWGVKHLVRYNIHLTEFDSMKKKFKKREKRNKKDLFAAHSKIRNLESKLINPILELK